MIRVQCPPTLSPVGWMKPLLSGLNMPSYQSMPMIAGPRWPTPRAISFSAVAHRYSV
jgi:hypothetical protein